MGNNKAKIVFTLLLLSFFFIYSKNGQSEGEIIQIDMYHKKWTNLFETPLMKLINYYILLLSKKYCDYHCLAGIFSW